ncbi:MAG: NAD(P)-binding protein, partial [Clostridiales bacterium]|nr:NAD(P)-binding protein [Clostridiales bacterium]
MIIGVGLGGLFAGNLLAARGHRVKIFESHSAPGGYTASFRREGFHFESGTFSFELSGMIFGKVFRQRLQALPLVQPDRLSGDGRLYPGRSH